METAIYSTVGLLFVGAMSGVSYLAVKHPSTYFKIVPRIILALAFIAFGSFGFALGVGYGILWRARSSVDVDRIHRAADLALTIGLVCVLAAILAVSIIGFLRLLAYIGFDIRQDKGGEKHDDSKGE